MANELGIADLLNPAGESFQTPEDEIRAIGTLRESLRQRTNDYQNATREQLQHDRRLAARQKQLELESLAGDLRQEVPKQSGMGKRVLAAGGNFFSALGGGSPVLGTTALNAREAERQRIIGANQQIDFALRRAGIEDASAEEIEVIKEQLAKLRDDEGARRQILTVMAQNGIPIQGMDGKTHNPEDLLQKLSMGAMSKQTDAVLGQVADVGGSLEKLNPADPVDQEILSQWQDVLVSTDPQQKFERAQILLGAVKRRNMLEERVHEERIARIRAESSANPPAPFESPTYRAALVDAVQMGVDLKDPNVAEIFANQPAPGERDKEKLKFFMPAPGREGSFIPTQETLKRLTEQTTNMQAVDPEQQQSSVRALGQAARDINTDQGLNRVLAGYKNIQDFLNDVEGQANFYNLKGSFRRQAFEAFGVDIKGSVSEKLNEKNPNIEINVLPGSVFERIVEYFESRKKQTEDFQRENPNLAGPRGMAPRRRDK